MNDEFDLFYDTVELALEQMKATCSMYGGCDFFDYTTALELFLFITDAKYDEEDETDSEGSVPNNLLN